MPDPTAITARSLLHAFLDFQDYCPRLEGWSEEWVADNPPRLIRLQRLKAMFQAFNLPWDPVSFTAGKFIDPEDARYAPALSKLTSELHPAVREHTVNRQLPYFFQMLFEYRRRVEDALKTHSGVLEASGLYRLALRKSGALNRIITDNLGEIESILAELISPEGREFTVAHLTTEFGYPDVDLWSIDVEWA